MKNIILAYFLIWIFLNSCSVAQNCDYSLLVQSSEYGNNKYVEIMSGSDKVYEDPQKINDVDRIIVDSMFNRFSNSTIFFTCSWLETYCDLGYYFKANNSCDIRYTDIADDLSGSVLYSVYRDSLQFDFQKERMFYLGRIKENRLSIYTNVIIERDEEIVEIPDATYKYILDLKTMEIIKTIEPPIRHGINCTCHDKEGQPIQKKD